MSFRPTRFKTNAVLEPFKNFDFILKVYNIKYSIILNVFQEERRNNKLLDEAWTKAQTLYQRFLHPEPRKNAQVYKESQIALIVFTSNSPKLYEDFCYQCDQVTEKSWYSFPYKSLFWFLLHSIYTVQSVPSTKETLYMGTNINVTRLLKKNTVYNFRRITSWSVKKDVAEVCDLAQSGTLFTILTEPVAACGISRYSTFDEAEVIIYPWSTFKIVDLNSSGPVHKIVLAPSGNRPQYLPCTDTVLIPGGHAIEEVICDLHGDRAKHSLLGKSWRIAELNYKAKQVELSKKNDGMESLPRECYVALMCLVNSTFYRSYNEMLDKNTEEIPYHSFYSLLSCLPLGVRSEPNIRHTVLYRAVNEHVRLKLDTPYTFNNFRYWFTKREEASSTLLNGTGTIFEFQAEPKMALGISNYMSKGESVVLVYVWSIFQVVSIDTSTTTHRVVLKSAGKYDRSMRSVYTDETHRTVKSEEWSDDALNNVKFLFY